MNITATTVAPRTPVHIAKPKSTHSAALHAASRIQGFCYPWTQKEIDSHGSANTHFGVSNRLLPNELKTPKLYFGVFRISYYFAFTPIFGSNVLAFPPVSSRLFLTFLLPPLLTNLANSRSVEEHVTISSALTMRTGSQNTQDASNFVKLHKEDKRSRVNGGTTLIEGQASSKLKEKVSGRDNSSHEAMDESSSLRKRLIIDDSWKENHIYSNQALLYIR